MTASAVRVETNDESMRSFDAPMQAVSLRNSTQYPVNNNSSIGS